MTDKKSDKKQKYTYDEIFQRNIGVFTEKEQEKIKNISVSIAGLGGVGGILFERLVRLGIEKFKVAEPDIFEISNLNRQIFSDSTNINRKKIDIILDNCKKINPNLKIEIFKEGVSEENVQRFVQSDIIVDAIEYNLPYYLYLLHKVARENNKIVLAAQAIGLGANLFVFSDKSIKFEDYIGLKKPEKMTTEAINKHRIPINKFCPKIPTYTAKALAQKIFKRETYIPSTSLGVTAAASLIEMAIIKQFVYKKELKITPEYYEIDFYELLKK